MGLTDGFPDMESSLPQQKRQATKRVWLITFFLAYGIMIAALLGYFTVYSDDITHEATIETTGAVTAGKLGRYQAVIANWNRYRGKVAKAEAR